MAFPIAPYPSGWAVAGAVLLLLAAVLHTVEGVVALAGPQHPGAGVPGLPVPLSWTAGGWVHLAIGALAYLAGAGLLTGTRRARAMAVAAAGLSVLAHGVLVAAQPFWGIVVITLDVAGVCAAVGPRPHPADDAASPPPPPGR